MTPSKTVLILRRVKKKARNASGLLQTSSFNYRLPVERRCHVVLGHDLLGVVGQRFRLREKFQTLNDLRIRLGPDFHTFILAESVNKNLRLDIRLDPVAIVEQISLRVRDVGFIERLAERLQRRIVNLKALGGVMIHHVALREVEERIVLQQSVLEMIRLDGRNVDVGSDAAAAVYRASAVGQLDFAVRRVAAVVLAAVVVVVVERNVAVITLNQSAAGCVVVGRRQRQSGIFGQRIHSLHQALAERDFTGNQPAIVILNRSGDDLSRRRSQPVDQNYDRIILAAIAVLRNVTLFCRGAPVMGDDELSLLQELVGNAHALAQQSTRIAPKIENQSLQIAERIESLRDFVLRGFVKSVDVHVADARLDQEVHVYAVARNLIAHQRELHRLLHAFARDADVNRGSLGSLQQIGHIAGAHVLGGFAVHCDNHIAGVNAGFVSGRPGERINHDHFVITRPYGHTDAVVLAALVFAHQRVRFWIEEIRVRIERVQHARNRPVVYGFVGVYRFSVVFLDQRIYVGELLEAVLDIGVARHGRLLTGTLGKEYAQESACKEEKIYEEERPARTTCHF